MVTDRLENLKGIIQYLMADLDISHQIPHTLEERKTMMRALMNVWIPKPIDTTFLSAQDAELQMQREEKGVATPTGEGLLLWQGDITRLKVDAIVNAANAQALGCWSPLHNCIDNCIHSAAGIQLRKECADIMQGRLWIRAMPSSRRAITCPPSTSSTPSDRLSRANSQPNSRRSNWRNATAVILTWLRGTNCKASLSAASRRAYSISPMNLRQRLPSKP